MPQDPDRKAAKGAGGEIAALQAKIERLERNLAEAFDRAEATNEILTVISNSPRNAQPVFETIVESGSDRWRFTA